jgi:hypothetical protein
MFPLPNELQRVWRERANGLIQSLCLSCPSLMPCRELGKNERHGIWGGTTEADRGFTYAGEIKRKRR